MTDKKAKEDPKPEETSEEKKLRKALGNATKDVKPSKNALANIRKRTGGDKRNN